MKLILGSKSPRRRELLKLLGFEFSLRTKETDESFPDTLPSKLVAEFIAQKKADELISELEDDQVIICADTTVIIDDKILGKPSNRQEAIEMLEQLSGREHFVITGVVIASLDKQMSFSVSTTVVFHPLTADEIRNYVDRDQPYDKAGSYGIQEWIGSVAIQRIEGSYNNVVGLPTHEVYQALKQFQ